MNALNQLDRKLMRQLVDGPRGAGAFQPWSPILKRLLASGHVQKVKPVGSKFSTMVGLSVKGAKLMGVSAPTDTCLDRFAERLAEHGDIKLAAKEIGCSEHYGRVLFGRIRKQLGDQAQ